MNRRLYLTLLALGGLLAVNAGASANDAGSLALCPDNQPLEVCQCATQKLFERLSPEDTVLYGDIGIRFSEERDAGKSYIEAWDAASAAVAAEIGISTAALMKRTNEIGATHQAAIEECSK